MNTENLLSVLPAAIAASTELTSAQKKVLGQLIVYSGLEEARNNGGWFYRSNEDLCSDVEVSNNTLLTAVRKLYDLGYIDRRPGSRTTGASEYRVQLDCTQIEPLAAPIAPLNCTLNCTHTLDDIYLIMSEILTELKQMGSIIGSVNCTHNCSDKGAKSPVNSGIEPIEPSNCTPDTDTDIETYNILPNNKGEVTMEDSCSGDVCNVPDQKRFTEQYNRIQRAVREAQTTDSSERIELLQRVMDDACEKARMYANEKQLQLIEYRISDFQKAAGAEEANLPNWIKTLPDATSLYPLDAAIIGFFQCVQQGLADTPDERQRNRYRDICLRRAKKVFTLPLAADRGFDTAKAESVIEGNFYVKTKPSENKTGQTDDGQEEDAYWQEYTEQDVPEQDQNDGVDRILDDISNGTISSEADLERRIEIASRTNELVEANASWLMDQFRKLATA